MNSKSVHGPPTFCLLLSYVFLFRTGCEFRMGRWQRLTQPNYTFLDYQKSRVQGKNLDSVRRYSYNANDLVICFSVNGSLLPLLDLARGAADALAGHTFILDGR